MINSSLISITPSNVASGVTYEAYYNKSTKMVYINIYYNPGTSFSSTTNVLVMKTSSYKPSKNLYFPASAWNTANGVSCISYAFMNTYGEIYLYVPQSVIYAGTSLVIFHAS